MSDRSLALLPWGLRPRLAILAGVSLLLRLLLAGLSACIHSDGPEYARVAASWAFGDWEAALGHAYHPLFPALMAGAHAVVGDWEWAGMAVSVLLGGLAVLPLHALTRRAFGEATADVAALLYLVQPACVQLSAEVLTVGTYLCFVLTTADQADRAARGGGPLHSLLAGACGSLAYLTRPDGVLVCAAAGLWIAAAIVRSRGVDPRWPRRFALHAAAFLGAVLVLALPYMAALWARNGTWVPTNKMSSVQLTVRVREIPPEAVILTEHQRRISELMASPVLHQLAYAFGRCGKELWRTLHPALALLLVAGFWHWRQRPAEARRAHCAGVLVWFPAVLLCFLVYFSLVAGRESRRYFAPPAALLLPWCAVGLLAVSAAWARRRGADGARAPQLSRRLTAGVVFVLVLASCQIPGGGRAGERKAGLWIRAHAESRPPRVLVRSDCVPFYAEGDYLPLMSTERLTADSLLQRCDEAQADWLVADARFEELFPGFFAWTKSAGGERFHLVYETVRSAGWADQDSRIRVYRVRRP